VKDHYVEDLQENERVDAFYLVQSKEVRTKKNSGEPYLSLTLSDRTGTIETKMWDGVEAVADLFDQDDFVKVRATVQLYRDKPQLVVHKLRRAEESEIELGDFIPHTKQDISQMWATLRAEVEAFENLHLKALLLSFLDDPEFADRFKIAPAAKTLHHGFVGGLLEHVSSLMRLAKLVASNYDFLDLELLQTGVVLHDMGKLDELTYERSFGYSSDGQLLGHITICLQWIDRKCSTLPDFPPRLKRLVEHMVLSHHGRYEFGSPKLPMFPEALALSYIDDIDSKLESMRASLANETSEGSEWTRYNPSLERSLVNPAEFLAGPREPAPLADPPPLLPKAAPTTPSLFGEKLQGALTPKDS
jgi:3'-5' exoribonuclease